MKCTCIDVYTLAYTLLGGWVLLDPVCIWSYFSTAGEFEISLVCQQYKYFTWIDIPCYLKAQKITHV